MLKLEHEWVWDVWPFDAPDGKHHLFFLKAPRALENPDLRHLYPSIGHAVSVDWRNWELLPDVLNVQLGPAPDDYTNWTGSVLEGPDGRFYLYYTGTSKAEMARIQRVCRAVSDDLITWERDEKNPIVEADPRWYEATADVDWSDVCWRDPWVCKDADGPGWHMLVTARANHGERMSRGVIGHAYSTDFENWEVLPPLSEPSKFGFMEVMQYTQLDDKPVIVFCCGTGELNEQMHPVGQKGGMWIVEGKDLDSAWDLDQARRVNHPSLYAARLITDVDGTPALIGFSDQEEQGFGGYVLDPVPVTFE